MNNELREIYKESFVLFEGAVSEITSRLDTMRRYRKANDLRDPVEHYTSRIKSLESIEEKLSRKNLSESAEGFGKIHDIAGVRVVCTYIDDVYAIADMLATQKDIEVIAVKDYIKNPKPNGYRSYHMIVRVSVYTGEKTERIYTEIQIRTIAMDFWASLEHQLKYKHDVKKQDIIISELRRCAEEIASTEMNFQVIRDMINEEKGTENEIAAG